MFDFQQKMDLSDACIYAAIELSDRFVRMYKEEDEVKICFTAIFVVSKVEEVNPISIVTIANFTKQSVAEVATLERRLLYVYERSLWPILQLNTLTDDRCERAKAVLSRHLFEHSLVEGCYSHEMEMSCIHIVHGQWTCLLCSISQILSGIATANAKKYSAKILSSKILRYAECESFTKLYQQLQHVVDSLVEQEHSEQSMKNALD